MAEQYKLYPHALTTLERVKGRMSITTTTMDNVLNALINACTDIIEGYCNRRFLEAAITNEVHEVKGSGRLLLAYRPPLKSISKIETAAGFGSTKTWTVLPDTMYEIVRDGKSGIVKIYAGMYHGVNQVRISYTGGYKIDFTKFGEAAHELPADITDLCERLVVKLYKRREAEGKSSESINQATISWRSDFDKMDKDILDGYTRLPEF